MRQEKIGRPWIVNEIESREPGAEPVEPLDRFHRARPLSFRAALPKEQSPGLEHSQSFVAQHRVAAHDFKIGEIESGREGDRRTLVALDWPYQADRRVVAQIHVVEIDADLVRIGARLKRGE